MRWVVLVVLAGCGPQYEWVEEPASPVEDPAAKTAPAAPPGPCAGSTPAVRQQARQGRYQGVEGFDSRGCVGPEPWAER